MFSGRDNFLILFKKDLYMNIYVGNLPYSVDENKVRTLFEEFGEVFSVKLIEDRDTGRKKGFGFVEMEQNGGKEAIDELNDTELEGRNIVVNEAKPKGERTSNRRQFNRGY